SSGWNPGAQYGRRAMHCRARAAGHEADAGPAGQLADRFRHHGGPALLPAHRDLEVAVIKCVEPGQIGLARSAERMPRPTPPALTDQTLAARPGIAVRAHALLRLPGDGCRSLARR